MFNRKTILVLFVDRNVFQFYGANLPGVVSLEIPITLLRDLEVVNVNEFYTFIKQFIKAKLLVDVQLVIIFSERSYFQKTIATSDAMQLETTVIQFFDSVPFESTLTRVYDGNAGKWAIATNKSMYEAIRQAFFLQGIITRAALPIFTLADHGTKNSLDPSMGEYVIRNIDALLRLSMTDPVDVTKELPKEQKKKTNLPLLLGVFGVLIVILIIMVVQYL